MRKSFTIYLLVLLFLSNLYGQSLRDRRLNEMIRAEYSFAKRAAEVGTRDAFLEFIADEGILFRPTPVNGKEFLVKQDTRPGLLSWYPSFAFISKSGDMGCTTGPAEFRKNKDSMAIWFGNFCTVWQLQIDGKWKFLIDTGNNNDRPEEKIDGLKLDQKYETDNDEYEKRNVSEKSEIILIDKKFNSTLNQNGLTESYKNYIDNDTRLLRDGMFPIIGIDKIISYNDNLKADLTFAPIEGNISNAGDFGYVFGSLEIKNRGNESQRKYNYLRMWRKNGDDWKILIEATNLIPQ